MSLITRSPKQLGTIIQRTRKQRSLTQSQLADLAGLRQEMISKIETGHEGTKLSTLYAIFAALDLELIVEPRSTRSTKGIEDVF